MSGEVLAAIIGSIAGSSGIFTFIQFLINRKDTKDKKLDDLKEGMENLDKKISDMRNDMTDMQSRFQKDIDGLNKKIDENYVIQSRIRILRANDEMRQDVHHSYEYFRQLHQDITEYEQYCKDHPEFKNNEAVNSIEYINRVYQDCLSKNSFLT